MTMPFNEFQRILNDRGIDERTAYVLTLIYEQISEMSQQMDDASKILLTMANTMQGLTGLHEATQARVRDIIGRSKVFGVDLKSVANDPEDK
jgi:hypothetical protein